MCVWARKSLWSTQSQKVHKTCLFVHFFISDYTHNPRLWRSPSTIEHTHKPMESLHLESISQMSLYVPCVSQKLKDKIWSQLGLGYTMK
jgi:hypothetical protein